MVIVVTRARMKAPCSLLALGIGDPTTYTLNDRDVMRDMSLL